jgi:hypothetical protein
MVAVDKLSDSSSNSSDVQNIFDPINGIYSATEGMQMLALAAIRSGDGQVVHESDPDPILRNSPPEMSAGVAVAQPGRHDEEVEETIWRI